MNTKVRDPWFVGEEVMLPGSTVRWLIVLMVVDYVGLVELKANGTVAHGQPVLMFPTDNLIRPDKRPVKATPGQRYELRIRRQPRATHGEHAVGLKDGSLLNLGSLLINRYDPEVWVEEDDELPIEG